MRYTRLLLHSLVLAIVNLCGIWLGFVVYSLVRGPGQIAVQLPIAFIVTVGAFAAWIMILAARGPRRLRIGGGAQARWVFGLSLPWAAVVFVPLHYLTQGYLTAFSNVAALWLFQAAANLVAVVVAAAVAGRRLQPADHAQRAR